MGNLVTQNSGLFDNSFFEAGPTSVGTLITVLVRVEFTALWIWELVLEDGKELEEEMIVFYHLCMRSFPSCS